MSAIYSQAIADELELAEKSVSAALDLFDEGATIPFVARYRKERTGALDEVVLAQIRDRRSQLAELDARKQTVLASLKEQGIDDSKLLRQIQNAAARVEVEDLYLPYRPKRRTRASVARDRGLGELADRIWRGDRKLADRRELEVAAKQLICDEAPDVESVLAGARDILAEQTSELPGVRNAGRREFHRSAVLAAKRKRGAEESVSAKFRDYFDWHEHAANAPSHRVLAIQRGCSVGALTSTIRPDEEAGKAVVRRALEQEVRLPAKSAARFELLKASEEAYDRLLAPQLETEYRKEVVARAEEEALSVFATNLRELLMAPPLGERPVLAIDPGFRTGCKVVALGSSGELLHFEAIYPLEPKRQTDKAAERITSLVSEYRVEAIAIGNGTGGRETMDFCRSLSLETNPLIVMVDESGASVYSAGDVARREFPDQDVTVRGAVSIGRRLQDPLAELVKVEPKSIGVGQYQHDVDQKLLTSTLENVVVSCVNAVGVDVNTASAELLRFVSGVSESLARRIVSSRTDNGRFENRSQLLSILGLGAKTFEQAAGFIRIRDGENPLDASAVHPERYALVERMATDLGLGAPERGNGAEASGNRPGPAGLKVAHLVGNPELVSQINAERYVSDDVGLPTIRDILTELAKPGRDPRAAFEVLEFREGVESVDDLSEGMRLSGIVTNVTNFGAFVDIGVHKDGLVHISKLADHFVQDPHEVVHVHQHVEVTVVSVDKDRGRIGLSMIGAEHE